MKKCYFCGGEIVKRKIRHIHQWGNKIILFEGVPAEVCKQCNEVYLSPDIIEMMDKMTANIEKIEETINIPVVSFSELAKV